MEAMLARLQGSPAICDNVRRSHRTTVPRDQCPAIHLAEGSDEPTGSAGDCRTDRTATPTVSILVRDDDGFAAADALAEAVMQRLDPSNPAETPYPAGVRLEPGRISIDDEIADADILRLVMEFRLRYAAGHWSLGAPT